MAARIVPDWAGDGAMILVVSLLCLLSCVRFTTHRVSMTLHLSVRERLHAAKLPLLRETDHWQDNAPESRAFASDQPFCMDTFEPLEWLQWVPIPRMHHLLDSEQPLPQNFAVAPYYEMALDAAHPAARAVLAGAAAAGYAVCR